MAWMLWLACLLPQDQIKGVAHYDCASEMRFADVAAMSPAPLLTTYVIEFDWRYDDLLLRDSRAPYPDKQSLASSDFTFFMYQLFEGGALETFMSSKDAVCVDLFDEAGALCGTRWTWTVTIQTPGNGEWVMFEVSDVQRFETNTADGRLILNPSPALGLYR